MLFALAMHYSRLTIILIAWVALGHFGLVGHAGAEDITGGPRIESVRIGFDGKYKVGHWTPVWTTIVGGTQSVGGRLELTTPDGDGIRATFSIAGDRSVELPAGEQVTVLRYAKFGSTRADLTVRLVDDDKVLTTRTFPSSELPAPLLSTQELIVSVGRPIGIEAAVKKRLRNQAQRIAISQLHDPQKFPQHWFGYEGVGTIVATTSEVCALERFDPQQIAALERWIQLGGRLILCVGSRGEEVFGERSPLARFSPGREVQVVPQRNTAGLEEYAGATERLESGRRGIQMTAVTNARGKVLSSETEGPTGRLPTIVRFPYGFGKVVFVAFDPDRPPFVDWRDRPSLVAKLLQGDQQAQRDASVEGTHGGQVAHLGYEDLVGQLRAALDQFQAVTRAKFSWVAGLIVLYILLIGPGDYFFLKKFGRMHWTWFSFPLLVLAFCVLAYFLANRLSGNRLHVNQVDLVDVDVKSSVLRGTMWAHVYSPQNQSFDLSLERLLPADQAEAAKAGHLLSWQGLPGKGLGGLNAKAAADLFTEPYRIRYANEQAGDRTSAISGLPILVSSSKSLHARWWADVDLDVKGGLTTDSNGLLSGQVAYPLNVELTDCMVFYQNWAYPLSGTVSPGRLISFDGVSPRNLEWRLGRRKVVESRDVGTPWDQTSLEVPRIMEIMMFHEAAGGESYTGLSQRYQSYIDLSGHIRTGRAVLIGRSATPASRLARDGQSLADVTDRHWTYYRVVFPVER